MINPHKKDFNRDTLDSINSSISNSIATGGKFQRDGINDLPKDGQRHFRKLSKELDRPKSWEDHEIESEILTPTSNTNLRSLISLKHTKESNSEKNSFNDSIGSERLVNIIEKEENKININ